MVVMGFVTTVRNVQFSDEELIYKTHKREPADCYEQR